MRLVVALLLLSLFSVANAVDWLVDMPAELDCPMNSEHSAYCYNENDTPHPGKQSSTAEDRLAKNHGYTYYDPPLSRYLNVMSANEYLVSELPDTDANNSQFITQNSIGLMIRYVGVEAFYKRIQSTYNGGNPGGKTSATVSQQGFGAGMPNANIVRAFVYMMQNDYSGLPNNVPRYSGIKAQLAKRFRIDRQFTEMGIEYENYDIAQGYYPSSGNYIASYFTNSSMDWSPKTRINGYLIASNIADRYMEPNNFKGLGTAGSPMLLVRESGYSFIARVIIEEREKPDRSQTDIDMSISLPINISPYVGLDVGYCYNKDEETRNNPSSSNQQNITEVTESTTMVGGLRFSVFNYDEFRLVVGAQYNRHKEQSVTEHMNFTANLIITISHHLALIGEFQHNNLWLPAEGAFRLDPLGYFYGSSLSVRL